MKNILLTSIILCIILASCGSAKNNSSLLNYGSPNIEQTLVDDQTLKIDQRSDDPEYGYTEGKPIMVGKQFGSGPMNERRFLNALTGPNGEAITYKRLGSCCHFKTKNGLMNNTGLLDMYEVAHKNMKEPVILYINMYDSDILKIPVGFAKKKKEK